MSASSFCCFSAEKYLKYFLLSSPLITEEEGNPLFSRFVFFLSPRVHGFTRVSSRLYSCFSARRFSHSLFTTSKHPMPWLFSTSSLPSALLPPLLRHPPSPVYQCLPGSGSLLSLLSHWFSLWTFFFHSIINPFAPWSFCSSRSSQKIPSLGSVYHQFSQLLLLTTQTVKENHAVMWTSANCNFSLLLHLYS